ncbi:hypothetical protein NQ318_004648 [Aromia moschata]|uniref:Uncharacterized protein n=1 Tax=Aromia moschata TaxID=1265417 RepID=A0AAV8Y4T6_9CUCU|nr:hypothetical protein NQ318_004648 [Aromia moschata]
MDTSRKYFNPSPKEKAGLISELFFCWILPFFNYGYRNDIEAKDIYSATGSDLSKQLGDTLERNWLKEIARASKTQSKPSLKRAIFKTFAKSYSLYGLYIFIQAIIIKSLQPIVLAEYIRFFDTAENANMHLGTGWTLGICIIFLAFMNMFILHHAIVGCLRIGMRVRVACCSLIYRKLLRLSQGSLNTIAAGKVVNLLSNDVDRFDLAAGFLHFIWVMPIQVVAALYIMFNSVGVAAVAGMSVVGLQALVLQGYLSRLQGKYRYKIALRTDHRVKIMGEIVSGIKVIKMYAWEKPFEKVVEIARDLEIRFITKTSYIKGISSALAVVTERFTLYLTIITYATMGNKITGEVVFSMAQLFNTVQLYMCILFPNALSAYAEAKVSIKRIQEFLLMEENEVTLTIPSADVIETGKNGSIKITDANASWSLSSETDTLRHINLNIPSGTLCCVVGGVGAGKSSLLQMLLKEMYVKHGKLEIDGTIAYASQEPWLFVSSVRDNILFGRPYIKNRYKNVIKMCALEKDLQQFPYGDKTLVGERGVSLSGGQRARINLARAVYSEADIYLLDDPLSAVDTQVGKHLFEECIMRYLDGKTRILVTHQLQFIAQADVIVVIDDGRIENIGSYSELTNVLSKINLSQHEETNETSSTDKDQEEPEETQELIEKGTIPTSTYIEYWRAGANIMHLALLAVLLIVAQMLCNGCDLTNAGEKAINEGNAEAINANISNNTNQEYIEDINVLPKMFYISIYTLLIIAAIILTCIRSFLFYKICMNASKLLHNQMFANILRAPMRFFDTTPSGRILNRFSKDMGAIDEVLPPSMMGVVTIFLVMIGILVMVFIVTPWMVIPAAMLGCLFYFFRTIYLKSAQVVKRIESVNRAPLFTHISASFYGLSTIRASDAQEMLADEFDVLQDKHTACWYQFLVCSETFGFYLDVISTAFLALVTLQFLIFNSGNSVSGLVGLVISSSMILTGMLQNGMRQTTDVANNMTSVERVLQYTKLQKEDAGLALRKADENWPTRGKITFENTNVRYVPEEPPVLRDINITVEPGEKIGIVGRTGAGKSSLISSLFRLTPVEGIIAIDDVDTSTIDLKDLRSNISIIPQEPVLFSATVRYNLDPFATVDDEVLWTALENVELKTSINSLDQMVSEGGSNFSAGQRQLICLARAIVRNNKILVMDEATANVDPQTDSLIQKTIRENFKNCTVLTIAHRLNTIMDSDKVLVLDSRVVEFAHAHELLQRPDGHFTKMVKETGSKMEEDLRKIAEDDYNKKFPDAVKASIESAMEE